MSGHSERVERQDIVVRRAKAGLALLRGQRLGAALREGGFSGWTARAPKRNRINARQCLEEAKKLDRRVDGANLLAHAREILRRKIESLDPIRESFTTVARMVELVQKLYGSSERQPVPAARTFPERVRLLRELIREAERRGLVPSEPAESASATAAGRQRPTPQTEEKG